LREPLTRFSIRIRPVSPGRRVSPSIYHPRLASSRGGGEKLSKLSAPPRFLQRLQPTTLKRSGQGVDFSIFTPLAPPPSVLATALQAISPSNRRQPLIAFLSPGDRPRRARGRKYKRLFPARQPSRGIPPPADVCRAGEVRREGKSGPPRSSRGGPLLRKG
jgi:hypothetical protein